MSETETQGPRQGRFHTSRGTVEFYGAPEALYELLDILSENNTLAAIVKRAAISERCLTIELGPKETK